MKRLNRKKCTVRFEPGGLAADVPAGTSILGAARTAGVHITSICGGDGTCGKCTVIIDKGDFETIPASSKRQDAPQEAILACQTKVFSDMTVRVPILHSTAEPQIITHAAGDLAHPTGGFDFNPLVRKLHLVMSPPTVHDHTSDQQRLLAAIGSQIDAGQVSMALGVLRQLPAMLVAEKYNVAATVAWRDDTLEVLQVEPANRRDTCFAVAIDLGTTTVVGHLIDLTSGRTVDAEAKYNSQIDFGEDYIRRIIYAEEHNAFDELQRRAVADINTLIAALAQRQQIDLRDVSACICAGNTAMIHFLLKLDSTRIRRDPYIAAACSPPAIRAADIGIRISDRGLLYCLPAVAAYVGADIVAGVLAAGIYNLDKPCLFVDIGTNGEVVVGKREWLVCASSSAGPAFEGSGIKHGARAAAGAIEKLSLLTDGRVEYSTIAGAHPIGICGSGLLDTLAELFRCRLIDRTGRFADGDPRVTEGPDGRQFQLVAPDGQHHEIVITQPDVNNLIRSKAGVFAAIKVLLNSTHTRIEDIDAAYIAGGFGSFLDPQRAVAVGLLPDMPLDKIHFVGNTSIAGAKMSLLSTAALRQARQIAGSMTYFDLMTHPQYMEEFVRACFLPHTDLSLFPSVQSACAGHKKPPPQAARAKTQERK